MNIIIMIIIVNIYAAYYIQNVKDSKFSAYMAAILTSSRYYTRENL